MDWRAGWVSGAMACACGPVTSAGDAGSGEGDVGGEVGSAAGAVTGAGDDGPPSGSTCTRIPTATPRSCPSPASTNAWSSPETPSATSGSSTCPTCRERDARVSVVRAPRIERSLLDDPLVPWERRRTWGSAAPSDDPPAVDDEADMVAVSSEPRTFEAAAQTSDAGLFGPAALRFFGDAAMADGNAPADEKGARLAELGSATGAVGARWARATAMLGRGGASRRAANVSPPAVLRIWTQLICRESSLGTR
jgi:hypothetical protein